MTADKPSRRRRVARTVASWVLTLAAAAVLFHVVGSLRAPDLPEAPGFDLQDLEGGTVRLEDLRGKPVILNFWAPWCGPCRLEAPAFSRFAADHPDFAVVGVSDPSPEADIRAAVEDLGIDYRVLVGDAAALAAWGVDTFPTTFVLDAEGRIVTSHSGLMLDPQLWWATRGL
ncbi:MAG: TlpA family protein disulfide reductase [Myxococcota bacterium]